jgi:peroxiredoxin
MAANRQRPLLAVKTRAPEFQMQKLGGGEVSLTELLSGGPVLLAFFKVTCPVCQMTLPFLERLHSAGTMRVFGISQNGIEDTENFARHFGLTYPMLLDSEDDGFLASNAYGISSVPTLYLINRDGTISSVIEGWVKVDMEGLGALREGDNVPVWKAG